MALEILSNSEFEIRDGQQNITGWYVISRSGEKIGEVEDLLFSPDVQKVRYLIIQLQASGEDVDDDNKRVLVPVGVAELHSEEEEVAIPNESAEELAGLPAYTNGELSAEDEMQIRAFFGGSNAPYTHPQFYEHEHFNDQRYHLPDNDEEPKSTEFPKGKVVGEFQTDEVLEHENNQSAEATGSDDYQLNEGFIPQPESSREDE